MVNAKKVKQPNHTTNTMQNQPTTDIMLVDDTDENEIIKAYISQLETNIEYLKEQCVILQTQKELTQGKLRRLEYQLFQCLNTQ